MDLTGKDPTQTYQFLVTTDRQFIYDGTGSIITSLTVANFTASHVTESFISASFITSSDVETSTFTASLSLLPVVRVATSMTFSGSNNNPQLFIVGDPNTGGQSGTISTSPAGLNLSVGGGLINFGTDLNIGSHNIQSSNNASTFFGTASNSNTSSILGPLGSAYDPTFTWDAQSSNFVGLAKFPSNGVYLFWQSASFDPPVVIMRTVGSQSVWSGVQSFTTASGWWQGTSSYAVTSSQGIKAWASMTYNGSVLTTTTYGCSASWIGTGSIGITLSPVASNPSYAVTFNGYSGSTAALATASIGWASGYTTSSFTMSVVIATSPNVKTDFTTASIMIQSY